MVSLAPACLHFVKDIKGHLLDVIKQGDAALSSELFDCLNVAVARMEEEIQRRLRSALSEIDTHFPQNKFGVLARRAPWDLIRMFKDGDRPLLFADGRARFG
jgi:hypothetical protein